MTDSSIYRVLVNRKIKIVNVILLFLCYSVAVNRVATYRELDNDLIRHAAFLTLVSFNFKKCLFPSKFIRQCTFFAM